MGSVSYNLGGVALPYASFEWPKYRGTTARIVALDCPAGMYDALASLARGLGGDATYLEVSGPAKAGAKPGKITRRIEGVYIQRVVKQSTQLCRVLIADRRILLSRRVGDKDYRVRFGDGFLDGTDYAKVKSAVEDHVASVDVLKSFTTPNSYAEFPDVNTRDKTHLSGHALPLSFGELLDYAGTDLTVETKGTFFFAAREDLESAAKLPSISRYSWAIEPAWQSLAQVILGRPREIWCYYPERHCIRLTGSDPNSSTVLNGPEQLQVELEQVYSDEGEIKTLETLLTDNGFTTTDLTDALIAKCFWSETFQAAPISTGYGTAAFDRVHRAVRNDWRRLWRIKFPKAAGAIGGWVDWAFGKINADGSVSPVAVECPWVEFLVEVATQAGQPLIGSPMTINHTDTSPFTVVWEGDEAGGVIRMVQRDKLRGSIAIPGALTEALVLEKKLSGTVEDGSGDKYKVDDEMFVIERQDIGKANFSASFTVAIYACATRRMPNNESRWWVEKVSGYKDGDIDYIELPVSGELYCNRDYVNTSEAGKSARSDGLGQVLNATALTDDATQRADAWKIEFGAALEGFGLAESIHLFFDTEVRGPINEVTLVCSPDGKIQTRISAGNLADTEQRRRVAAKRLADRKFKTAGSP